MQPLYTNNSNNTNYNNLNPLQIDLDAWLDNLTLTEKNSHQLMYDDESSLPDDEEYDEEALRLESIFEGSYNTLYQGVRIVFELEGQRLLSFLTKTDIGALNDGKFISGGFVDSVSLWILL